MKQVNTLLLRSDQVENVKDYIENNDNQKGATSIFVMIFMVILLVFGLAALTTSLASLKLADKNHSWSKEYYQLEANAEKEIAQIDQILFDAEVSARNYITEGQYLKTSDTILKAADQKYVQEGWLKQDQVSKQEDYLEQLLQFVYMDVARAQLSDYLDSGDHTTKELLIDFTVKEEKSAYPKMLQVGLKVLLPLYDLVIIEDGTIIGTRNSEFTSRFQVIKWQESQTPFEYSDDINFENPNFEDPGFIEEVDEKVQDGSFTEVQN